MLKHIYRSPITINTALKMLGIQINTTTPDFFDVFNDDLSRFVRYDKEKDWYQTKIYINNTGMEFIENHYREQRNEFMSIVAKFYLDIIALSLSVVAIITSLLK